MAKEKKFDKKKYRKSQEKEADKIEMVSKLAKRKKDGKYFPKNEDGTKATDYRSALNTFKVQKLADKSKNPGLSKLPTQVRNKMGYMKKGGRVMSKRGMGKAMRGGGCVR